MTTPTTRLDIIAKALGERCRHDSPQWVNEVAAVIDSALPPDSPPLPVVLPEVSDEDLEAGVVGGEGSAIPSDAEDRIRAAVLAEDAKQREGVGR